MLAVYSKQLEEKCSYKNYKWIFILTINTQYVRNVSLKWSYEDSNKFCDVVYNKSIDKLCR